jgi:hypothetical protein
MSSYFIIYGVLWLLALLRSLTSVKKTNAIFFLQVALLMAFSALRFETGYDWPVYGSHYEGDGVGANLIFEPGYELLVKAFVGLGIPFRYYVSVISILMVGGLAYIVKKLIPNHKETALLIMFALPDFFLIPIFSVIRQTISLLFFLLAIIYFYDGRRKTAIILAIAAFSFHYSTIIICGLLLLFGKINLSPRQYVKVFLVALFAYLTTIDPFRFALKAIVNLVLPGYSDYLLRDTFNASPAYRVVSACLFGLVAYLVNRFQSAISDEEHKKSALFRHAAFLTIILPIALFNFPTFTSRFMFFGSFFIVGYSLYSAHHLLRLNRILVTLGLGVIMVVPLYRFLGSPFSSPYVPYQSMLYFDETNSTGTERTQELLDMLDSLW